MSKKVLIGAAIGALMVSSALAQSPSSSSSSPASPPAASAPAKQPDASAPAKQPVASAPADKTASGKADFIMSQKPDQWLASKFKGTNVVGADNEKIGDVSDILFDKTGKIEAYVVSVGGFLGMGAKEVALAPSSFDVVPGENGSAPKLKISLSKDQLTAAQNFARYEPPRPTTTGSAPGGGGLGGGMRPSGGSTPPAPSR